MMDEIRMNGLQARNPLGFLAALGALEVASRFEPTVTLHWSATVSPRAVLTGISENVLISAVRQDAAEVLVGPVLNWPVEAPLADLKMPPEQLRRWADELYATVHGPADRWITDLWAGLVSEYGVDNSGQSKPTHLHFTAGQQKFLVMARAIGASLDDDRVREAVFGPWRYDSTAPSLSWDNRGERSYARRGFDPSGEKRQGVPAADWLAFRGLAFYPTAVRFGRLATAGCQPSWKTSTFRWPVWVIPMRRPAVRRLVVNPAVSDDLARDDAALLGGLDRVGLRAIYRASIRRSDQGGYGSFGAGAAITG